jgi:hypothetical protein
MGPVIAVVLLFAVAAIEAVVLPPDRRIKATWLLVAVLVGGIAAALVRGQHQTAAKAAQQAAQSQTSETAALRGLWSQWDSLSAELPKPKGEAPASSFDSVDDALASLSAKVATVRGQLDELNARMRNRSVDPATAVKLADYLRQRGSYRAIVSCPPDDLEAYTYANQLANILRAAGWDANGPETTAAEEGPAMAISLYVRNPAAPDAAKVLIDAFAKFNIPYQSAIAENDAIPDPATVELYVAKKP